MRKLFVTGIGTDVGKTVVSSVLVEALKADYWKPVQTGSFFSTDTAKVQKWVSNSESKFHPEGYMLKQYMSPHAAAELEDIEIRLSDLRLPETNNTLIIEGAGGLMVPLNRTEFMIDMIQQFDAEVVLVIQNYLGSINHTLLSIDALKNRKLKILGVVFNGAPHQLSQDIIMDYCQLKVLGRINKEKDLTPEIIKNYANEFEYLQKVAV
ncbi:MAG: ATP-dependent dethiobiotin synthetase BioD [Bacteroidetes bacterium]|nr:ATP-dependent dethiobiotin synthetase BioD [Bacteroidota bacterium]